jgi:hypothetical protein
LGVGDIKRAILNMAPLNMGTLDMPTLLLLLRCGGGGRRGGGGRCRGRFRSTQRTLHDAQLF